MPIESYGKTLAYNAWKDDSVNNRQFWIYDDAGNLITSGSISPGAADWSIVNNELRLDVDPVFNIPANTVIQSIKFGYIPSTTVVPVFSFTISGTLEDRTYTNSGTYTLNSLVVNLD